MTLLRPATVILSRALTDIDAMPAEVQQSWGSGLLRSLDLVEHDIDQDFEDTKDAGYIEGLEAFAARIAAKGGAR